jgi:LacI family transcriptional regulator
MTAGRPRLYDVAEMAAVSLAAASRILRGDTAEFSASTCDRVLAAASTLGWRPNLLVRGAQTGRTQTIGVVVPPYDSFWVGLLSGINSGLAQADYLPINVWPGDADNLPYFESDEEEGVRLMNRLLDRRVDGLILWPPFALAYAKHVAELRNQTVPVVVIDYHADALRCDTVATNEAQAMRTVAEHLLALGHRRFGYIGCRETSAQTWALERRRGFEAALAEVPQVSYRRCKLNSRGSDGFDVATKLLRDASRPTAVVAATDHEAVLVYQAAAALRLRIPEDVSVVGFADLDFAAGMIPPLTTVRQRASELGRQAAALILGRLNGSIDGSGVHDVRVDAELVGRGSTGPSSHGQGSRLRAAKSARTVRQRRSSSE